jgi:radical SAM superfamily enzyme YgiQ (UPF0313 family)
MTLGILKVAAVLERAGFAVDMIDLSGIANYEDAVIDYARSSSTLEFGITATTPQLPAAANVAAAIRSVHPSARVILGGPHVTLVNAAYRGECRNGVEGRATRAFTKLCSLFDVLVAGDGEEAIFDALRPDCVGLIDADNPKTGLFLNNAQLTELPLPARHLVDVASYRYTVDGIPAVSLIAQLGCPFGCGFCGGRQSPSLRRVRMRTTKSIIAEMVSLYRTYGYRGFMFYDDELNVNPKMLEMMRAIDSTAADLGVEFRLRGFVKAELFTYEQAEAMYRAGFRWLLTGFESGSPRILKNINKKATLDDNSRCAEVARRHNLKVKALMSIGHPGESSETVMETRRWLLEVRPDDFDVTIITPYPGSPYYDSSVPHPERKGEWVYTTNGDRLYSYEVDYVKVADYYKGDPDGGYSSFVYTDYLSPGDLVRLRDYVERDVRQKLQLPFNPAASAVRYDHSMGQFGVRLPTNILRSSAVSTEKSQVAVA